MRRSRLFATLAALVVVAAGLVAGGGAANAANLLTNPGFEAGSTSGWSCGTASVVSSPVHSGSFALAATAGAGDTGQCTQTVSVLPNTTYTVSAWVRGNPVYLGITGGTSTWANAASYTQLSLSFTTAASQTSVELFLHGWYGAGTYNADDVVLDGPGGGTPGAPGTPGAVNVGSVTNSSIALSWGAAAGTVTGYRVYEGSTVVATVTGTSTTIGSLPACSTHSYAVAAFNSAGESAKTSQASGTTTGCVDTGLPKHSLIGYLHASFANGSGYVRMADIPAAWDIIDLAF